MSTQRLSIAEERKQKFESYSNELKLYEESFKTIIENITDSVYEENLVLDDEETKKVSSIIQHINAIKDMAAKALITVGNELSSSSVETKKVESFIDSIEIELTEEDLVDLPIVLAENLSSKKILPKPNSLCEAEISVMIANELKDNFVTAKLALINKANVALLLHKNLKRPDFAKQYLNFTGSTLTEGSFIKLVSKYDTFRKMEKANNNLIHKHCNINYQNTERIENIDMKLKDVLHKSAYPLSYDDYSSSSSVALPEALTPDEAFVQFGKAYIALGLPDPQGKLESAIQENVCKIFSRDNDLENEELKLRFHDSKTVDLK